jgi:type IV pilus assembly protein PilN
MMQRFNLLPHQAMRRQWGLRVLGRQLFVTSMLGCLIALAALQVQWYRIEYVEGFNKALTDEILAQMPDYKKAQSLLAERASLLEKKAVLERVDARRTTSVLIMADLVRSRPDGLYFTKLEENGESFRVEGRSIGGDAIARFFERVTASGHIRDLVLEEIQLAEQDAMRLYGFVMHGRVNLTGVQPALSKGAE